MNLFAEALAWLTAPEQWTGTGSLPARFGEHLYYTILALLIAAAIAVPLGYLVGHTGRGKQLTVALSGAGRALPSLGLLTVLTLLVGVENVDGAIVDSARAMGMTRWQVLSRVEAPLGLPLLVGGLRSAALHIVATAVLAAYVGLGGLGIYIQRGISLRRYEEMLGGAIAIVVLALVVDALFALLSLLAVRAAGEHGRLGTSAVTEGPR